MKRGRSCSPVLRPSFTLVEMLLVVAIIALLLTMAVPGFTRTWEERKQSQAVTLLNGLLASTRAKAVRNSERGLFFYISRKTGEQMIIPIVAAPPDGNPDSYEYLVDCEFPPLDPSDPEPDRITECVTELMTVNRFHVSEGDEYALPRPIRVVPREVLQTDGQGNPLWPEADIAHQTYLQPDATGWYRHPNFFTIVFGPDGRLVVGRDVIIRDIDRHTPGGAGDGSGDRTGLPVADPTQYYAQNLPSDPDKTASIGPTGSEQLHDILVDENGVAVNFRSVDGLLVYDESVLADIPYGAGQDLKRRYLVDHARPIYVSPLTGEVLQGPMGENQ